MKSKGFTLIELVVVIVILGILAAISIPRYVDMSEQAKISADRSQLSALRASTHLLYAQGIVNTGNTNWPAESMIISNMTITNIVWKSANYTNVVYNSTNGTWTVQPGPE